MGDGAMTSIGRLFTKGNFFVKINVSAGFRI